MKGITVHIETNDIDDESIQLVLNDAEIGHNNNDWKIKNLYTSNSYNAKAFKELSLSKEQYAEIGENIILRLLSLNEQNIKSI